jgi:4-O-beta-D-mannosyl-D-glucose phosphorylase
MHVAETDVERLMYYTFNTPQDPFRSLDCAKQRKNLIEKNEALLRK